MASARELLDRSRALQDAGQVQEALSVARQALDQFRAQSDQAGAAEAQRSVLGGQIELLELTSERALQTAKDEVARIKKSAPDGKLADAVAGLAVAEVLLFRAESDKALKAASDAAAALAKEGQHRLESAAWQMVVNAQLMRSNSPKAVAAANNALSAAQKAGDRKTEAAAWLAVATARHVSGGEDSKQGTQRALGLFRELNDRAGEAATLTLQAQIELAAADFQAAQGSAADAMAIARDMKNGPQTASALEVLVDARLGSDQKQEALAEAEAVLVEVRQNAAGQASKGVAATMAAVLLAHTAAKGIDSALDLVKQFVHELRDRGDRRGEARMLHKLSTMSPVPPEALNSAQAALALAQQIGDATQEVAIKKSMTDMYAAKGKVEKAPNRKTAMKALSELAKALENQEGEKFDDAAKYLDGYYNALKQEDIEAAMARVIAKDPETYMQFLKDHGQMIADEKPTTVSGHTAKPVPYEVIYFGFRTGGLSYGPRYRVNVPAYRKYNSETNTISIVELPDVSDQWERELMYSPSLLDGCLQSSAAGNYNL